DKDDAIGCHHECRDIIVHPGIVDVARQLADFLTFILCLLIERPGLRPCLKRKSPKYEAGPKENCKTPLSHARPSVCGYSLRRIIDSYRTAGCRSSVTEGNAHWFCSSLLKILASAIGR